MNQENLYYSRLLESIDWNFVHSKSEPIHSIHPYPAKFIPEIPRKLLEILPVPANTFILDPFCGSGVTLVEAQRMGFESAGVDLNPIACLISKVKTQNLPIQFNKIVEELFQKCMSFDGIVKIPEIPNLDHWFEKDIQEGLAILVSLVKQNEDEQIRNALEFCVSSIIVKVSNQESDTRYASKKNSVTKNHVFILFKQAAEKLYKQKINCPEIKTTSNVINHDSLLLNESQIEKKIGLVITSPPYPNAYEYWLYHKYRMWWLNYDPIEVKKHEIGARVHYFKKDLHAEHDFCSQMDKLFQFFSLNCVDGAFICFVIGRSRIHGEIINNEEIIKESAERLGMTHITTVLRDIKSSRKSFNLSHARIKQEYIVIVRK